MANFKGGRRPKKRSMPNRRFVRAGVLSLLIALLIIPTCPAILTSYTSSGLSSPSGSLAYGQLTQGELQGASPTTLAVPKGDQGRQANDLLGRAALAKVYNITLITGDVVLAWVAENGTVLSIAIEPAHPAKLGQNFLVLKIFNSTYVIPSDVDVRKFDLELFNVDLSRLVLGDLRD